MKKLLLTKMPIFNLRGAERTQFFSTLQTYVYVYCEIDEENRRVGVKKVRMRDITFGRRDLKKKNKNKKK